MNANFLNTKQVAEQYNVQVQTVSRWCQAGRLQNAFKVGRDWLIPQDAVESFDQPQRGRPKANGNGE